MRRVPSAIAVPALLVAAAGAVAASLFVGPVAFSEATRTILWEIRFPRALLTVLVGACLATSGAVFQGLFRNPLADPFVVGVSGGAALGAVGALVAGVRMTVVWGIGSVTLAAFVGGVGAAFLSYGLARVRGRVPVAGLLLAGSAIGAFTGAMVSVLLLWSGRNWNEVVNWLMGRVTDTQPWDHVLAVLPFAAASLAAAGFHARELDLLLLGEEPARQLGAEVERVKPVLLAAGAVAAAAAVATCGIIGFVGLIVPHLARLLVGPGHRALLPVSALGGGVLLTLADLAARAVSRGTPLPVGAVTALCGAPFFVWLLRQKTLRP